MLGSERVVLLGRPEYRRLEAMTNGTCAAWQLSSLLGGAMVRQIVDVSELGGRR